jgi:hypothetical protein
MRTPQSHLKLAAAAVLFLSATGCYCVPGPSHAKYGVTMLWTFAGHKAFEVDQVKRVIVTIPGQTLQDDGNYAPTTANVDGIKLLNFVNGTYTYTLRGVTDTNTILYEKSGSFTVSGETTVSVDLEPLAGAPAYAYVSWTFPETSSSPTPNCAQANGVSRVSIAIDNGAPQVVNCVDGFGGTGSPGVLISTTIGQHTIELGASDATGFYYFTKRASLPPLVAGGAIAATYSFDWAVGSLPLKWSFPGGSTCAQNGITELRIDLVDEQGAYVYPEATGAVVPCATNGVQGTQFPYLYGGIYRISLQAYGTGNALFHSNLSSLANWPRETVIPGRFPQVSATTPVIPMTL